MAHRRSKGTNGWDALRDIMIASMAKGQFPLAIIGAIFFLIILKMPSEHVGQLAEAIINKLSTRNWLGYVLWLATSGGWFFHAKWQRKIIDKEMRRVAEKRTELQGRLTTKKLESSTSC